MAKKILVVDGEQIIRNVLKRKIEQSTNNSVVVASNGPPALEIFNSEPIDLVITDLLMHEFSGLDLLRQFKEINANVPVIIVTGYGTLDDAIDAIHLGAEDFIKKPFDINEVLETIEKTFRKQEEQFDQSRIIPCISNENIQLEVPNDLDYVNIVINFVCSHLKASWSVTDDQLHDIKICLYEALVNAIEHGNLGISGEEKSRILESGSQPWRQFLLARISSPEFSGRKIRIGIVINDEEFRIRIHDEGEGFDYEARVEDERFEEQFLSSGRGLLLIQNLMDGVEFEDGGRCITIWKSRIQSNGELSESTFSKKG